MRKSTGRIYENGLLTLATSNRQKAWASEISGTDEQFGLKRDFLDRVGNGAGWCDYALVEGKVYSWKEYQTEQFGVVEDGVLYEISKEDVLEILEEKKNPVIVEEVIEDEVAETASNEEIIESVEEVSTTKYKAQEKYQAKVGLMSKSYKLDKALVEQFSEACSKADITQAKQLSIMMQEFIDIVNSQ